MRAGKTRIIVSVEARLPPPNRYAYSARWTDGTNMSIGGSEGQAATRKEALQKGFAAAVEHLEKKDNG